VGLVPNYIIMPLGSIQPHVAIVFMREKGRQPTRKVDLTAICEPIV
jgi:hypothetical protein